MLYFSYSRKWYLYEKGFTLVELLAVIVILAIILAIAIPGISNIIESSKRGTAESNAKMLFKAIEYKTLANEDYDPTIINETNVVTELGIDASNYESLTIKKMNGQIYITMVGKDKLNGITVSGTKKNIRVDDSIAISEEGANHPVLAPGMIPIKWVTDHWEVTTEDDWYDYNNKEWANAVTRDCVIENEEPVNIETCSMWVWIPRYIYKISPKEEDDPSNPTTGWHKSNAGIINVQFSKGVDDNWNKAIIGNIDFSEGAIASNNKWTNHPAFTFGDIELTGIWVAKFEASSNTPEAENGGGDKTSLRVRSVPNVPSWRYITINNAFKVTRAMETVTNDFYGLGTSGKGIDTHLMKNSEWGAVAYLSHSEYGKNSEIHINPSSSYITGRSGATASQDGTADTSTDTPTNLYGYDGRSCSSKTGNICTGSIDTTYGTTASTTGNIYGVYDMSGGATEYIATNIKNTSGYLNIYGLSIMNATSEYKDVYTAGVPDTRANNYDLAMNKKGDALYETSTKLLSGPTWATAWYGDSSSIASESPAWFSRGGAYDKKAAAGIFAFDGAYGYQSPSSGFRPVLLVQSGL